MRQTAIAIATAIVLMGCEKEKPTPSGWTPPAPVDTVAPCTPPSIAPGMLVPMPDAVVQRPLYFQWVDIGAEQYILQVEMYWTQSSAMIFNGWVYDTRHTVRELPPIPNPNNWPLGVGRWRVKGACDNLTQGPWSDWRSFTIAP